jgi:6-phosphogluconolactonase
VRLIVAGDAGQVAARAADWLVAHTLAAVAARGRAALALSGGRTPWDALERFAQQPLPWSRLWITQVDERIVGSDDPRRHLRRLQSLFAAPGRLPPAQLLALPVEAVTAAATDADRETVLAAHARQLQRCGFDQADVVQLGLGADGHTASLLPGDPLLEVGDAWVGMSRVHEGTRRLTLTLPALAGARALLWIVTGEEKSARLAELWQGRGAAPATRLPRERSTVICDAAAAQELPDDDDVTA